MSRHDPRPSSEDDDDDLCTVPAFTAEDERRDIESLTLADLVKVQADLAGLTSLLDSLQPSSGGGNAAGNTAGGNVANINPSLIITNLEAELHRLPQTDTEEYYKAVEKCPHQVDHKRKMIFLGAINNDVRATAAHIAEYWKARVEVFGKNKAYLPMTLGGAMGEEKMNLASRCVWQLLPYPDTAGRPVLFFCPSRRNFAEYSAMQEIVRVLLHIHVIVAGIRRVPWPSTILPSVLFCAPFWYFSYFSPLSNILHVCIFFIIFSFDFHNHPQAALWYFLETIIEEESLRRHGFVILADMRNYDWQRSSKKMIQLFTRMVSFMPIELMGSHLCYPNAIVHHLLSPLIKRLIPRSIRLRFKTHHGTPSQVLTELSGFCLPVDRVPVDMGGMLAVNAPEWVMKRQVLETLRQHSASTVARGLAQHQRDNPQQLPPISDATTAILSAAIAQVQGPASLGQSHQPTLFVPQPLVVPQPQPQQYPNIPPNSNGISSNGISSNGAHTGTKRARAASSSDGHFAGLSDYQLYEQIVERRHTNTIGRKSDPRMNRALALALQNPGMSRPDAIVAGGFAFPDLKSISRATKDSEGISLKQRTDQLGRRVREAEKWIQHARQTGDLSGSQDK